MTVFQQYIALGDSISISFYASMDYMEKHQVSNPPDGLGAAMLFYKNNDEVWPKFKQRDLSSLYPQLQLCYHASDGATTTTVLDNQLPELSAGSKEQTIITMTVGGNNLLFMMGKSQAQGDDLFKKLIENLEQILQKINLLFPNNILILGTVYDPSDNCPDIMWRNYKRDHIWFYRYNDIVREICEKRKNYILADIHKLCYGHGYSAGEKNWFYATIEPGVIAAHEIRRLWLKELHNYNSQRKQ
ncbi:SGNH/GDSL hydrolase family protein [Candidatus Uabimicrobium sp. HlEnr_7]|uniref:SGNH/GDSL hydrolase family protein n=1 Tax=Candidatus Uabimicrobium helgolandensis TaxID=3095367 RepID=UPI0035578814